MLINNNMKKILFTAILGCNLIVSCNKENPAISEYKEIAKGIDLKNFSDVEKLEYFSKVEFKNFELYSFSLKQINDSPIKENQKTDFSKDKIDFNVKVRFTDKTKFFGITDNKIEISDAKKEGFYSTNDASVFVKGYFKDGRFYFTEINKLGF